MAKFTKTDEILAAMLTENTGRHMLDSGGAYGRSWERNQGKTVETFIAAPAVTLDTYGVTLDIFHWLRDRLEYDAELDRKLEVWNALYYADSAWLEVMETFAAKVATGDVSGSLSDGYCSGTYNSYNHENALSQTIQFTLFDDPEYGEPIVLLQIHGGADVRGGYTQPRAFRVTGGEASDMLDFDGFSLWHDGDNAEPLPGMPEPEQHGLDHRNTEWIAYGGSFERDPWNGAEWIREDADGKPFVQCPYCVEPTPMSIDKYPI
jgi:hypothetical protein